MRIAAIAGAFGGALWLPHIIIPVKMPPLGLGQRKTAASQ
jgi:hypothetical protein